MRWTLLIFIVLLVGCSSPVVDVVENSLSYKNPEGFDLNVTGHKDTTVKGLKITKPNGVVIEMDEYQSVANAAAVAEAGAEARERLALIDTITRLAASKIPSLGGPAPAPSPQATAPSLPARQPVAVPADPDPFVFDVPRLSDTPEPKD